MTMAYELTPPNGGFSDLLSVLAGRVSNYARWNDTQHWRDRDGVALTGQYLVGAIDEGLQHWKDKVPTLRLDKPLPDPDELNSAIPKTEWQKGVTGEPEPPWHKVVVVLLIDPATGALYKFTSPTQGARIAFELLREALITMHVLRGSECMPLVALGQRPMKTKFGMGTRPHFEIIGWKTPGGDGAKAIPAQPPTPQLPGPAAAPSPMPTPPAALATASVQTRQPKPPVNLAANTVAAMGDVKPVSSSEVLNDEIKY
jgi:hypothetical protein